MLYNIYELYSCRANGTGKKKNLIFFSLLESTFPYFSTFVMKSPQLY